jgi:predicted TIM-barrel fold metal-dependent hydrolase
MIIDAHTHAGRGERLSDTYQVDVTFDSLLQTMAEAGVEASCVMGVAAEDYAANNREIYEVAQAHPGKIIGFARANLHDEPKALAEIRRGLDDYGFRGVKIHVGLGDGFPTRKLMELLSEYGCPLLLHTPQDLGAIDAYAHLARSYPKVPVVMGHMGVFGASWPGFAKLCAVEAKQIPNLYLDTAFVFRPSWIKMAAEICGPEKVLFASDAPVVHPAVVRKAVEVAGFSEGELGLILGGNAARLLKLDAD